MTIVIEIIPDWVRAYRSCKVSSRVADRIVIVSEADRIRYTYPLFMHILSCDFEIYGETVILHAMTAAAREIGQA